jgi:hypothetical protein
MSDGKTFDKIELPEPTKKTKVTRKGKKSIAWNDDPEILKRLGRVAEMMLDGKYSWEIAQENKCSIATAKRDVGRVREIWKSQAMEKLDNLQADSLATYNRVVAKAWRKIEDNPEKADQYLRVIIAAQERVDKLAGIGKPEQVNVNLSGEVEVKDIDKIRDERWQQVADSLLTIKES